MKVCAVGLRGIPDVMGGIESHCQQLYPRMVSEGVAITVIGRSPYLSKRESTYHGVKIRSVWAIKNKFLETILHTFLAILYARFVVKPDILHIHGIGPALYTPLAKLLGFTVIVTHHGADYDRQKWNSFAKGMLKLGESMAVRFADKTLVVGRSLTYKLKRRFSKHASRIFFIPNGALTGVDASLGISKLPKELGLKEGNYILTVGRLVPEKGFHDLIDAYRKCDSRYKLVIVGNADHEDEYSMRLISQRSANVIFADRRQGDELQALYKFARVFVLPSYHEGLPIVALEAISAGTDVLASDIDPNTDIGLPSDCYFPVGDVAALADKLSHLDRQNLKLDKDVFLARFNWDEIALDTRQLMEKTLPSQKVQRQTVKE
ncbi:glycosyltransferase family 4 protein [Alteromonas sp. ASW11-130]|uniref:glycosyltransferase family 4 protein n=1 Tax=Alteromonas sp. ASW11-130 TaxID=3015775 RepID=UPI002241AC2F|nr:glycosyltransferase family 4 protein [Alteromonas sp. ASW11-130]MCW8090401.1 glycosyltransferase family 4 protein [Alteromonas sp. ASW11-130]